MPFLWGLRQVIELVLHESCLGGRGEFAYCLAALGGGNILQSVSVLTGQLLQRNF